MPDMINPADVKVFNSPGDPLSRPITTSLTQIDVLDSGMRLTFDKKDGAGRWPDITPPGWTGPLQYTLWLFLNIGGAWYGSGLMQFWYGLDAGGGNITADNQIAKNWVYDSRWGPMQGHQPAPGETVGFMVSAGNARGEDDHIVAERSDIVTLSFPAGVPKSYTFGATPVPLPVPVPVPVPVPPPAPSDVDVRLAAIEQNLSDIKLLIASLKFPKYKTTIYGTTIVLTPQ